MDARGREGADERFAQEGVKQSLEEVLRFGTDAKDADLKHKDTIYESHDGKKILLLREFNRSPDAHHTGPQPMTP